MSGKQNLKKSNILKRLSIPSISEIKYKESLLNSIKDDNSDLLLKKNTSKGSFKTHNNLENKGKNLHHQLELKIRELENSIKLKDEELIDINKKLEDEKNKVQKLKDIITEKELNIDLLKKSLDKYETNNDENHGNNTENKLIKIDIINKKIEYNLNMENNQLKEDLKIINNENVKLKEELNKNKEIINNLQNDIEKYKIEINRLLNENKLAVEAKENAQKKLKEKNIIKNKQNINEEIENLKKDIKRKEDIISKLNEENNYYIKEKNNADKKICEINIINENLQKELENINNSMKEKEKCNNDIINYLREEAIEAKIKCANSDYLNDLKYMKLKKKYDKLISILDSHGIKVKILKYIFKL